MPACILRRLHYLKTVNAMGVDKAKVDGAGDGRSD